MSIHFQIKEPRHQARWLHSATAITHSPTLVEVILFGGCGDWIKDVSMSNTVVLLFGESTSCVSHTSHGSCDEYMTHTLIIVHQN